MSQVLIINEDKFFGNSLKKILEKSYQVDALAFLETVEAHAMLEIFPDVIVIVCLEKNAIRLCEFLIKNYEKEVHVLIIGNNKTIYPTAISIPKGVSLDLLKQHVGFLLGEEASPPEYFSVNKVSEPAAEIQNSEERDDSKTTVFQMPVLEKMPEPEEVQTKAVASEYTALNLKYFIDIPEASIECHLYSRIKKGNTFEYTVKFAKDVELSSTDIERLITRGVKELFVETADYKKIHERLSLNFLNRFKKDNLSTVDKIQLNSDSFEIMLDVFKNSSMNKYSVEIIKEMIKLLTEFSHSPEAMLNFTAGRFERKLSYGYSHLHLTCILIFQIVDKFPWSKEQSKNKIIYLSLFHDMGLHNDRLIKIHHNHALEMNKLSDEEKLVVHNHADVAATILENIIKAPKELTSIIREHHGLRSGKGFLESLSLGVMPLTMAFIVTEDFVTRYLDYCEKSETPSVEIGKDVLAKDFSEMKLKFDKLTYLDVVVALEEFFKNR